MKFCNSLHRIPLTHCNPTCYVAVKSTTKQCNEDQKKRPENRMLPATNDAKDEKTARSSRRCRDDHGVGYPATRPFTASRHAISKQFQRGRRCPGRGPKAQRGQGSSQESRIAIARPSSESRPANHLASACSVSLSSVCVRLYAHGSGASSSRRAACAAGESIVASRCIQASSSV